MKHIDWDDYFAGLAVMASLRSKDPNTKVGAVIVNEDNHVIGCGYNGFPTGCDESQLTWNKDKDSPWLNTKYPYVVHSELNAILNTVAPTKGAKIYVTLHPCCDCAKAIIQSGIKEVIYLDHKYKTVDSFVAADKLMKVAGVISRHLPIKDIDTKTIIDAFQ